MKDKVKIKRKYTAYILTILGFISLVVSIVGFIYGYIIEKNSITITSTIKSIDVVDNNYNATVTYKVNDVIYENSISLQSKDNLTVDDKIELKIDITSPKKIISDTHYYVTLSSFILGVILTLATTNTSKKYYKESQNIKYLKREGLFVQATITEIIVDNNGKKYKGQFPYRLRCNYLNPKDNNLYIFDSEATYENPDQILRKYNCQKIIVYINPTKPSNYYVDLTSLIPHVDVIDPIEFMRKEQERLEAEKARAKEQEKTTLNAEEEKKDTK